MQLLNDAIDKVDKHEIINTLIDRYNKELDNYQFDSILIDILESRNEDIEKLYEKFRKYRMFPIDMYTLLINFIVEELGFADTVDNLLTYNYKYKYDNYNKRGSVYDSIFRDVVCKETFILERKIFPIQLFSRVEFKSDVILDVEIIPESGFKSAKFNKRSNGKLIIKEGCKEIKEHAFDAFSCKNIYLPSTLTRFEHTNLGLVSNIHYAGTSSEFLQLLSVSNWWDKVSSVGCDIYCTDGKIS